MRHRTATQLAGVTGLIVIAALAVSCRKSDRHFVPAPAPDAQEADAAASRTPAEIDTSGVAVATTAGGDGDTATGTTTDGDGDGDGPSGKLTASEAADLLAFLDAELPADLSTEKLLTKLARKCAIVAACVEADCRGVLASCKGDGLGDCGTKLAGACPRFREYSAGAGGDPAQVAERWIRDLWGDLIVNLRLSLPDKDADRVDTLAERHGL